MDTWAKAQRTRTRRHNERFKGQQEAMERLKRASLEKLSRALFLYDMGPLSTVRELGWRDGVAALLGMRGVPVDPQHPSEWR